MTRRIRAVLVTAVLWALIWLPLGTVLTAYRATRPTDVVESTDLWFLGAWIVWAAVSGALFAVALTFAEAGRGVADLSTMRSAVWGGLGSLTLPAVIIIVDFLQAPIPFNAYDWQLAVMILAFAGVLGAGCAAGTLALARRVPAASPGGPGPHRLTSACS